MSAPPRHDPSDPLLVRIGIRYFMRLREHAAPVTDEDGVHFLNARERAELSRIARANVRRAAIAGGLSTLVAGTVEVLALPLLGSDETAAHWHAHARFWAIVGVATILTSIVEIGFLYWDALRSVHRLATEAGLDLFPDTDDEIAVAAGMARAALEVPNPRTELFGINPLREASKLRLLVASIAYKAKISVSNFLIKALIRRMLGRAAMRAWLPFVAVPVTAAWNASIAYFIMREAKIRALGPSAARQLVGFALEDAGALSEEAGHAAIRAVAASIVRKEELHPNLAALLHDVMRETGLAPEPGIDDTRAFLDRVARLDGDERAVVVRVLVVATVLDGRISNAEKAFLRAAYARIGATLDLGRVEALRRAFVGGDALTIEMVRGVV